MTGAVEEYVRSRWEIHFAKLDDQWMPPKLHIRIAIPDMLSSSSTPGFSVVRDTESAAWQAAYEFTLAREEEIRQVREDCCVLIALATNSHDQGSFTEGLKSSLMRVLAREQAHLDSLLVGWKGK